MRLKQIGKGLALAAGLLLSACTNDGEMEWQEGAPTTADSSMGTLTFQIAGLPSTSTLRADEGGGNPEEGSVSEEERDGIQFVGESEVQHLVAVLFKGDGNQEIGEVTENNDAEFVRAMDVFVGNEEEIMKPGVDYSLPIDKSTSYVVCFIANPGHTLLQQINKNLTAGRSTVNNLKALVEDQDPDNFPKMMTSNFYKVYLDPTKENVTLGEVRLTRSMARIDIVNNAQNVKITKIVVNNRIVKSLTMSDEPASPLSEWIESSKEYNTGDNGLIYGASYLGNIYCYEVLSTEGARPTVDIYYTKEGFEGTKMHTVQFVNTNGDAIYIKRNTRYNITVTSQNEPGLNVYLRVADWTEGDEFGPGKGQIADGVVSPGDYLMKNGLFISSSTTLTEDQKDNVIGVVFYVTSDIEDSNLGADVKNYLRDNPSYSSVHGKAISLKNDSQNSTWASLGSSAILPQYDDVFAATADMNGYGHSLSIWNLGSGRGYSAFDRAKAYRDIAENTYDNFKNTGWYLPSEGEFNLLNTHLTAVDNALVALGEGAESLYGATYWSSSEKDASNAWRYELPSLSSFLANRFDASFKPYEYKLRFVIAF